jgi:aminoglycoside 6'-N-acetyltransferase I
VLANVSPEVFDKPINAAWYAEFFADPRHHLVVALDEDLVVGMASGVHYLHPDKAPQLFINEVAVASTHAGQGIGRKLVTALVEHGRTLGANEAWVLTSPTNEAAERMYRAAGALSEEELNVMFTYLAPGVHRDI